MNRIILIGNGFDLAHNLETSYKNFIDWLLEDLATNIEIKNGRYEDDIFLVEGFMSYSDTGNTKLQDLNLNIEKKSINISYKNNFYTILKDKTSQLNWVDIEEEYYQQIKNIIQQNSKYYKDDKEDKKETAIVKLNRDFEIIKQKLEDYLSYIFGKGTPNKIMKMYDVFFDNLKLPDISNSKKKLLIEYVYGILMGSNDKYYKDLQDYFFKEIKLKYGTENKDVELCHLTKLLNNKNGFEKGYFESSFKIYPRGTLILNFNYTKTESLYSKYDDYIKSIFGYMINNDLPFFYMIPINIHGELNSRNNPIIFGYGDELADEYKEFEKLQDKEYFKNIKSIKYLQTNNYRKLLDFADSDFFQIYTLGHSCGNSDRTLLNTLFEHDNCVSIKPFFYEKTEEDGTKTNDYEEIVINISRNFTDKKLLRERVVNKTFCKPLPQMKNEI